MSEYNNKNIYNELYNQYAKSLENIRTQYSNFSYSRRECWIACNESSMLKEFIEKCAKHKLPYNWYQWAINREEDLVSSGAIYSD